MQSLSRLLAEIEAGRLSPADALAGSFQAIDKSEVNIGAFEAIADIDETVSRASSKSGPLAGVAVGIKDILDTADLATGYGSPIYDGFQPRADAAVVAMARAAGASIVGKTVTTEFAFFHPGKTRNPHDPARSPGGSSSGSAAAVAAGMIPAAIGTQTGGSIIRPASYCGVAGYKPSFRLVPVTGMKAFSWTLDTAGFFAASVVDVALFADLIAGRSLRVRKTSVRPPKIGLYRTAVWDMADPEMREAVETAASKAERVGASILVIDEPEPLKIARDIHTTIQNFEGALSLASEYELHRSSLSEKLVETLEAGQAISPEDYDKARGIARKARKAAYQLFDDVDVLLTPSATGIAPIGLQSTGEPTFNKLWTLTGLPCVNVPGLKGANGLPLGVQIVGRFGRDMDTIQAASWLETALTG